MQTSYLPIVVIFIGAFDEDALGTANCAALKLERCVDVTQHCHVSRALLP